MAAKSAFRRAGPGARHQRRFSSRRFPRRRRHTLPGPATPRRPSARSSGPGIARPIGHWAVGGRMWRHPVVSPTSRGTATRWRRSTSAAGRRRCSSRRVVSRKVEPVARGRDVGVNFRPDGRGALFDEAPVIRDQVGSAPTAPTRNRSSGRPRQAQTDLRGNSGCQQVARTSADAGMPYPTMPGMLPNPYGGYWPAWR